MGGRGWLVLALRNPELYRSVSAFGARGSTHAGPLGAESILPTISEKTARRGDAYIHRELVRERPFADEP